MRILKRRTNECIVKKVYKIYILYTLFNDRRCLEKTYVIGRLRRMSRLPEPINKRMSVH